MKGIKKCKKCGNKILPDQEGVMLMDFKGIINYDKHYWHKNCYIEWINISIENRAKDIINNSMKKIMPGFNRIINGFNQDNVQFEDKVL